VSRPLRAIFFDAGNTLIHMDFDAIAAALAREGVPATADEVQRAEWRARVRLDATFHPGASTEHPDTGDRYVAFVLDELGVKDPDTVALARRAGLAAAVISNSNGTIAAILDTFGLGRHLDFVIDSSRVGVEKPDPRIFRIALERARLSPEDAAYIGDLYSIDVLGARAAGLSAVLVDPGRCWPPRDCPTAPTALHAVQLLLDGTGP
jgi:HAD superfamily hydrolase (TIGR01509 family)